MSDDSISKVRRKNGLRESWINQQEHFEEAAAAAVNINTEKCRLLRILIRTYMKVSQMQPSSKYPKVICVSKEV